MRTALGYGDDECAALAGVALDADGAAVQLRTFLNECKLNPGTFVSSTTRAFDAMETGEYAGKFVFGNAYPVSSTVRWKRSPASLSRTVMLRASVNLKAFETRLRTIVSHMSLSM